MSQDTLRIRCIRPGEPPPNIGDFDSLRASFRWSDAKRGLIGLPGGGLNIAHEALDRWVATRDENRLALRFIGRDWSRKDFSYGDLSCLANRFANVLEGLGLEAEDRVFTLMGRIPELYVTLFGALKFGAVVCPLFSGFRPDEVQSRLEVGRGRVLVTTLSLYQRNVEPTRNSLTQLDFVLLTDARGEALPPGTLSYAELVDGADEEWSIPPTDPEAMALLHFSRGATGRPKCAVHVHAAVIAHYATGCYALDLHPDDIYWCAVDPGWVTGIAYGAIAPLVNGASMIIDPEPFEAERWYRILQEEGVNVWYTTPKAIRRLMQQGNALATSHCFNRLRHMASVGGPLDPDCVVWGKEIFALPFHDTWSQTETGGIMIANFRGEEVRPGAMGRPVPGVEAAIVSVSRPADGSEPRVEVITEPDREGELALRAGWPSMFRGYLGDKARYRRCFAGDWYLSGDRARRDADGWFWYVGRAEEAARPAGRRARSREVESVLVGQQPRVAEPDHTRA
jgi:acetyl-CoA synthetase